MLNQSMPVASRTRGKREDGILKEYKKKKKREEEEKNKNHIRPIAEASTSGRHEGVHIIDLSDDTDDDDDFSTECSDDPKTSTSGEDNDDSEDLDFWEEEFDLMGAVDDDDDDDEEDEDEDEDDEKEIISVSEHNAGKSRQVYNSRGMSLGKKRLREDEDATIEPKRRGRKPKLKPSSSNKVKESADDEDDVDLPSIETKRRGRKPKLNSSNTVDEFDADDKDNVDLTPIEPKRRGRKPKLKPSSSNKVEESADDENDADLPSIETKRRGRKPKLNSSNTVDESDADDKDDVDLTRIEPKRRGRKPKLNSSNKVDEYAADDEGYVGLTPKVKLSSSINVDDSTSEDDTVDLTHEIDIEPTSSGRKPKKHRRRKPEVKPSSSKKVDLVEVLAYSIWDKEDSDSALDETLKQENNLPVGVVDKMSHEKADSDEDDMGNLWAEMQFCLASSEIGSTRPSLVENKEVDFSNVRRDRAFLCQHGNHQLILDEEIGMKCRYCSYVELEIRYIVPPFLTGSSRRHERRDSALGSFSMFEGLQCEESNCDMPSNDPSVDIQGTVWEIIPDLRRKLYSHQREGFQFIWNNIAGGIYRDPEKNPYNNDIGGCIVSHAPGTGKTLLTIVFLYTYMKVYPASRPVIVAPKSMLLTWEAEFRKWSVDIPFHNLNDPDFSGKEKAATIGLYEKGKQGVSDGPLARRLVKLLSWKCDGGILGISYTLFEKLAGTESKGKRKCTPVDELVSNALLKLPGLFVFDEGHIPRNDDTLLWKALSKIKTERRIILSGTPFQNNFDELFNTLCLVRPKFAEGIQSGHQRVVNKTRDGKFTDAKRKWTSMTDCIGKVGDGNEAEKLKELRAKMAPFVHVHKGTILQSSLPGLRHSVVVLQPSDLQKKILDRLKQTQKFFALDYYEALVSIHPSVLQQSEIKKDKEIVSPIVRSIVSMDDLERIRLKPDEGVKTKFLKELIRLSLALNEKVIVFSQFLEPLNLIMDQLRLFFNWKEGEEILYMDGKCHIKQRQSSINAFNDPTSKARVLLASTKACSEGINLIGGSRVVLLDVTWNPSVERQALSRAYRLGQKKVVYTYNLISSGTMDVSKCQRQAGKDRISNLVFSAANKDGYDQEKPFEVLQDSLLEEMVQHKSLKSMFKRIINQPKDSDLIATFGDLSEPTGI